MKNVCYSQFTGRILNRFSKDIGCIDELLPPAFYDMFTVSSSDRNHFTTAKSNELIGFTDSCNQHWNHSSCRTS